MRPPQLARFIRSTQRQAHVPCRNCDTVFSGKYCPECGQETFTGAPTAVEFIYEFLTRNAFERGKMPRTIWRLLRYPGALTVDFLEGRRQQFIRPVRLYFGLSILYFLLLSLSGNTATKLRDQLIENSNKTVEAASQVAPSSIERRTPGSPVPAIKPDNSEVTKASEEPKINVSMLGNIFGDSVAKSVEKRIKHFIKLPQEEQLYQAVSTLFNQAPKAMFFLVPIFALLLKTMFLWQRIPYGAHLLFAFHYHAFLFLTLALMLLHLPDPVAGLLFLLMHVYLFIALRTTYLCSRLGALWRWLVLAMLYPIIIFLTLALATLAAVFII
jgi:hypothetical protein